jgi:hypothetical protein
MELECLKKVSAFVIPMNCVSWLITPIHSADTLNQPCPEERVDGLIESAKAHFRAKVEHPFRVIKQQFGLQKTRLRGMLLPRPQSERGGATRSDARWRCWQRSPTCLWRGMGCYARHD